MKYLITGLGNIGAEYKYTRHNIGFMVLDHIAEKEKLSFTLGRFGEITEWKHKGRTIYLLKPTTYMNLSGKAVRYWLNELNIPVENSMVITDDVALPVGKLRLRPKGSAGGHNGLKSIEELIQTSAYPRLKFGVGDDYPKGRQADYVLGRFTEKDMESIAPSIVKAVDMIVSFVSIGLERTMTLYN